MTSETADSESTLIRATDLLKGYRTLQSNERNCWISSSEAVISSNPDGLRLLSRSLLVPSLWHASCQWIYR